MHAPLSRNIWYYAPVGPLIQEVSRAFGDAGIDLGRLGLGWARVAPTVAIVPAFGLRALPAGVRVVLGVTLALALLPAIPVVGVVDEKLPWIGLALLEVLRGLPIAIAAAVPLWAATMAGGVVDGLRGSTDMQGSPVVHGKAPPLGILLALLSSFLFLATGGPARILAALSRNDFPAHPLLAAARDLSGGIGLAVALAAPLLAASIVLEVSFALVARAASPAHVDAIVAPVRALAVLTIFAVVADRIAGVIALSLA